MMLGPGLMYVSQAAIIVPTSLVVMAWIDCNGLYYGTWDYTSHGYALGAWKSTAKHLQAEMAKAKCTGCHGKVIGGDWINLQSPELSRILRAPLAAGAPASATRISIAVSSCWVL